MKRGIVWFKTDLRLHDNETLVQALKQCDDIIPVYCFDPADYATTSFGTKKTGEFRFQFLMESLTDLDQNLRQLGSGLIALVGDPAVEIAALAKAYHAQIVFSKKEVAPDERRTQERLEKELWKNKCLLETYSTSTLYHAQDMPFSLKDIPNVFTNFRKRIEKDASVRPIIEVPTHIASPTIPATNFPQPATFGLGRPKQDPRTAFPFKGGETAARSRVKAYFYDTKAILTYKATRNELIGEAYSSKFSPWLALGCISARDIHFQLKQFEAEVAANDSTYWLVFELIWRDYFRFMMKKYRHLFFLPNGIKGSATEVTTHNPELFEAWKNGTTGVDFVDANMIELKHTGFMSNRGRQNVASYLCNDLGCDWRYGAAYFEEQLIDYDASNNWGNWAYLAGVGNDPRDNRVFNIEKQANDYDKNEAFRKLWGTII